MNLKRKLCGLMALCMLGTTALTGCGGGGGVTGSVAPDDPDKEVTLRWVIPWYEQTDYSMVMEEINKRLPELLPNTKLELVLDPSMGDKWSLWMAGGTSFDIAHSGYATDLQSEINKQAYLPLDDLIDRLAPTIKEERDNTFKDNYLTGTYQGSLYAIPNNQYHIQETKLLVIPEDLKDYLDIQGLVATAHSSPTTQEDFYKILGNYFDAIKAANVLDTDTISTVCDIERLYEYVAKRGYEFIGGNESNLCYKVFNDGKVEIINFYETEEFKTFIRYANEWYKKGYISKDVVSGGGAGNRQYTAQAVNGSRIDLEADSTKVQYDSSVKDYRRYISLNNPEYDYTGAVVLGNLSTYQSIPTTAQNPERAMKLLELLRTEEGAEILNLLCYGIEDVHYKKLSDQEIDPFDYDGQGSSSSKYGIANWLVGSLFDAYVVNPPYDASIMDYGLNYYQNLKPNYTRTPVYGLSFDNTKVSNKLAQMASAVAEYEMQLICGVLENNDETYNNLQKKLEVAGMKDVIAEFQKQADAYEVPQ
ncbi:MAG: ABC transporter substrate-binding protein [Acutalibacteraceae bacterium]